MSRPEEYPRLTASGWVVPENVDKVAFFDYNEDGSIRALVDGAGIPFHESADWRGGEDFITTKSAALWDFTEQTAMPTLTNCAAVEDTTITRWSGATLAVTPSTDTAQFRKTSLSVSIDPVDQLGSIDVYIPIPIITGMSATISMTLYNVNFSANFTTWGFNLNALRQGWNTLKFWCGDTNATATTPPTGTLGWGCSKSVGGTAFDPTAPIAQIEVNISNLNGVKLNFDGFRKGCKAKTCVIMGFDSTGRNAADNVFTKANGVAEFFKANGIRSYFTATALWDLFPDTVPDQARKDVLYRQYGWDCLPHFWNHGASLPGGSATATSAARTTNVVTFTANASLATTFNTAMPNGKKFYAMISGATPSDFNGLAYCTVTGTTTFTYASTGSNGSATGTVVAKTSVQDVVNADDATRRAIMRHELVDLVRLLRARGWNRGLNVGAYPQNSVGVMEVMQPICAEAGIKFFRSIKKSTAAVTEFGVDNPLHFGSVEMGNEAISPTLTGMINALTGAMGRGEHLWTYGHYILDETDPENSAHANANLIYGPGQGGNPSGPSASGTWYFGTLKRFINETLLPLRASGAITLKTPTEWAANLGSIDGTR